MVDYTRAPDARDTSQQGPAIAPVFEVSETEAYYWTGTTLLESPPELGPGAGAVYIAFGQAWGYMFGQRMNVHGAGAQRSDPKSGDPADWAGGLGPQGDEIRIFNYARCVRAGSPSSMLRVRRRSPKAESVRGISRGSPGAPRALAKSG